MKPNETVAPSVKTIDYKKANTTDFRNKSPFRAGVNQFRLSDINYTSTKKLKGNTLGNPRTRPEDFLIVREFQPDLRFNWVEEATKIADFGLSGLESLGSSFIGGFLKRRLSAKGGSESAGAKAVQDNADVARSATSTIANVATKKAQESHMKKLIDDLAAPGAENTFIEKIITDPVNQVKGMLSGNEVAYFEVPYNGDVFLTNMQSSFWKGAADLQGALANGSNSAMMNILKDSTAVNFPATPTWNSEEGGGAPEPLSIDLVLYNNNLQNLVNNYKYIHGLMQGVYWSQIGFFQKSSNLYDITLPGRFRYFFCTLEAQVQFVGKRRRLPNTMTGKFNEIFSNGSNKSKDKIKLSAEIANNGFFPDAYRLTLTFKSLMPNNYNMYLQYFINGSQLADTGAISQAQFASGLSDTFKALGSASAGVGEAGFNEAVTNIANRIEGQ